MKMKRFFTRLPKQIAQSLSLMVALCFVSFGVATMQAANIISAGTGQWSATGTWVGGVVPTAADNVSIESGHTVTVSSDLTAIAITDASSTTTTISVTTASAHGLVVGQPVVITGNAAANGTGYVTSVTATTFVASKSGTATGLTTGGSIAPQRMLTGTLTLNGGSLTIATGAVLTMSGTAAVITRASASGTVSGTFTVAQISTDVTTLNINVSCNSGVEAVNGNGKNHLVLASGVTYTMASTRQADDVTVPSTSTVAGSNALTIRGTIAGTGTFTAPVSLRFGSGSKTISGATFGNLTVNYSGTYTLSGSPTINGVLTLTANHITLSTFDLTLSGTGSLVSNGSFINSSYIVINSSGKFVRPVTGGASTLFPMGTSTSSYDPVNITPTNSVNFSIGASQTLSPAVNTTTKAVSRIWNLTATGAGATALTFTTPTATLTANNTPGTAVYGHYTSAWAEYPASYSVSTINSVSYSTWTITSHSAGFSPFGVGVLQAFNAVLAVELTTLKARNNGKTNLLTWTTASEKDNASFIVERSANGQDFVAIGTVKGNGTSAVENAYNFSDENPLSASYYRVKSVDFNGATVASKVVSVSRDKGLSLKVYPSVVSDVLTVEIGSTDKATLTIRDITGKTITTQQATETTQINTSTLPKGLYILSVEAAGFKASERIVKQ